MKFIFYLGCFVILNVISNINCSCSDKGVLKASRHREVFLSESTEKCREYTLGALDNKIKNILVIFDFSNIYINCSSDSIVVYNENRKVVVNYCDSYKQSASVFALDMAKNFYVQYNYGGKGIFSVAFDWLVLDFETINVETSRRPLPTTVAPKTSTSPVVTNFQQPNASALSVKNCGEPTVPMNTAGFRIVGGGVAAPNSHPWQVYLTDAKGRMTCGGSLINSEWVLTAAHCVDSPGVSYKVYLGTHDLTKIETGVRQVVPISKVIMHQKYDLTGRLENDIALLKLEKPITFTKEIIPICLPSKTPATNTQAIVTGWGLTRDGGSVSRVLNQVAVTFRDSNFCRSVGMSSSSLQICAGNTISSNGLVKDSCQGDSGGPLISKDGNRYVLNGVVSYGGQSCNGIGVYTNVAGYIDWIDSIIKRN